MLCGTNPRKDLCLGWPVERGEGKRAREKERRNKEEMSAYLEGWLGGEREGFGLYK